MEKKKKKTKSVIKTEITDIKNTSEDGMIGPRSIARTFANSGEIILSIAWYVTSIKVAILVTFDADINIIEDHLDSESLFELITEISREASLIVVINSQGLKIGIDEFLKNMKTFYPDTLIKKAIVPERSDAITILKKYTDAVRYNMTGKSIISSK